MTTCYTWAEFGECWSEADFTWNDVCIAVEIEGNAGIATTWLDALDSLDEPKKKRFIEVICRVKTQNGGEVLYEKRKTIKENITITSEDVRRTVNQVLKVRLVEGIK